MKSITAEQIAQATSGKILHGSSAVVTNCVSTDSRKIPELAAFFALVGENFDAHDYLDQVVKAGAKVIVCENFHHEQSGDSTIIQVKNTLKALQDLAAFVRSELSAKRVAVTGSNGKTSTKDFIKAVLESQFITSATLGNFNNHIGLPLTILATKGDEQAAIWEMGMNHPGEIAPLCEIGMPEIGVITNIGTAHIEFMGSREAIALEKGALAEALPTSEEGGTLIVPASCDFNEQFASLTKAKVLIVGAEDSLVTAKNVKQTDAGSSFDLHIDGVSHLVTLPVIGEHMVSNALLAAAVGYTLNIPIENIANALSGAELTSGRLRVFESSGVKVIDDTYNANPESVKAALKTLADVDQKGAKIAVLGKLGEQGEHETAAYQSIGEVATQLGLTVISVGDRAKPISDHSKNSYHFSTNEAAAEWLKSNANAGDTVLFKGSRAAAIEKVMNLIY
ncbi:UDP-N-acetylmuramoyl-tripeptide--D-alanyl-D-alanine ligase [Akkermansiaceae bacterium]|nr:UDP-N-acetylmuramoyl-tripeptide--D-alanyl-D-alanine ligase [Akkermansiaceae bacterium]